MMLKPVCTTVVVLLSVGATGFSTVARAQPWDLFEDALSVSAVDVVNTSNAELVVLSDTGQLVIVSGPDVILEDTFVDANNDVFFEGYPAGFITFADDGDGYRTVWWLSLTGYVVHVDGFTGEPSETDVLPSDFTYVADDACAFWDDPTVCEVVIDDSISPNPVTINFCGAGGASSLAMTALGLGVMGFVGRRRA